MGGVVIDSSDNSVYTGTFFGTVNFGGTLMTAQGANAFLIKNAQTTGNQLFAENVGGFGDELAIDITADDNGNLYILTEVLGSTQFGGNPFTVSNPNDMGVIKYNGDNFISAVVEGGAANLTVTGIAHNASGSISYTTGHFNTSDATFGNTTLPISGSCMQKIYVAKIAD
jgi:hypothetical protein